MYAIVPCMIYQVGQHHRPSWRARTAVRLACRISSLCRPPRSPASSPRPRFRPRSFARASLRSPSSRRLGTVSRKVARQSLIFSRRRRSMRECEILRFDPEPTALRDVSGGGGDSEGDVSFSSAPSLASRSNGEG